MASQTNERAFESHVEENMPDCSCDFDALASGGSEIRKQLETLRANRHLSTRELERLDNVLKSQSAQPRAVPDGKE